MIGLELPRLEEGMLAEFVLARWNGEALQLEQVVAAVTLRAGARCDDDALEGFCAERLPRYEVPERMLRVNELPLTAKGSVDRNRLAEAFGTTGHS